MLNQKVDFYTKFLICPLGQNMGRFILLLFLAIGLFAAYHPTILSKFELVQTDLGDTRFVIYLLEHGFQWITGNSIHRDFWSPPFFFPALNVGAYAEILLGSAPIYWLFRFLGFFPDTSFQLWAIAVMLLNYFSAYLLLRNGLKLDVIGSIAGSYLFAFGGTRIAQLGHQQLLPQFFSVIAIWSLLKIYHKCISTDNLNGRNFIGGWIFVFFAGLVLQFYAGFYLGWFLVFGLCVFFVVSSLFKDSRSLIVGCVKANWISILLCVLGSSFVMSWLYCHYSLAAKQVGMNPWEFVDDMIPQLKSWINMGPENWLYGWTRRFIDFSTLRMEHEHRMGLGIVTTCLALYGFWRLRFHLWGKILILSTIIIMLMAFMYPGWVSPWEIVWAYFPAGGSVRSVTRVSLLLLFPIIIGLAICINFFCNRRWVLLLLVIVCSEQLQTTPSFNKFISRAEAATIATSIPADCKVFYYIKVVTCNEPENPWWKYQLDAMLAQLVVNKPTINGYSGRFPLQWELKDPLINGSSDLPKLMKRLNEWAKNTGLEREGICIVMSSPIEVGRELFFGTYMLSDRFNDKSIEKSVHLGYPD